MRKYFTQLDSDRGWSNCDVTTKFRIAKCDWIYEISGDEHLFIPNTHYSYWKEGVASKTTPIT